MSPAKRLLFHLGSSCHVFHLEKNRTGLCACVWLLWYLVLSWFGYVACEYFFVGSECERQWWWMMGRGTAAMLAATARTLERIAGGVVGVGVV